MNREEDLNSLWKYIKWRKEKAYKINHRWNNECRIKNEEGKGEEQVEEMDMT